MKAYKGFDKNMRCRGFQYENGKTYETEKASLCNTGFHACEDPLNVFRYYPPANSRYCEVELDGVSDETSEDTKRVGTKITVGAEIGIPGIVKAHVEWVKENVTKHVEAGDSEAVCVGNKESASAGLSGSASAGWYGSASAGEYGSASAGKYGSASAGESGSASAGEYGSASAGEYGSASAGWYGSASAGLSGSASAGKYGSAVSRGKSSVEDNGCAVARGNGVKVRGGIGSVLVLVKEYDSSYEVKHWKAEVVDGKGIKADTWYQLDDDGNFVEVTE